MIGRPEWFTYRIFGWGLRPKTWQGWIYVAVFAALIGFLTAVTINNALRLWLYVITVGVLILDMIHIMTKLESVHDERENYHQLIIERNASFAGVATIIVILLYQAYQNRELISSGKMNIIDYPLIIVLFAMAAVKLLSTFYLKAKK